MARAQFTGRPGARVRTASRRHGTRGLSHRPVSALRRPRLPSNERRFAALRERVEGAEHRREGIVGAADRIEVVTAGVVRQPRERSIPLVAKHRSGCSRRRTAPASPLRSCASRWQWEQSDVRAPIRSSDDPALSATTGNGDIAIRARSPTSVRRSWRRAADHRPARRSVDRHAIQFSAA